MIECSSQSGDNRNSKLLASRFQIHRITITISHNSLENSALPVPNCSYTRLYNVLTIWNRTCSPISILPPANLQFHLLRLRQPVSLFIQPGSPEHLSNQFRVRVFGPVPYLIAPKLRSLEVLLQALYQP